MLDAENMTLCSAALMPDPLRVRAEGLGIQVEAAAAAGFTGISLWALHADAAAVGGHSREAVRDMVLAAGLTVRMVEAILPFEMPDDRTALAAAEPVFVMAEEFDAPNVSAVSMAGPADPKAIGARLRALCRLAADYGLTVLIEFLPWSRDTRPSYCGAGTRYRGMRQRWACLRRLALAASARRALPRRPARLPARTDPRVSDMRRRTHTRRIPATGMYGETSAARARMCRLRRAAHPLRRDQGAPAPSTRGIQPAAAQGRTLCRRDRDCGRHSSSRRKHERLTGHLDRGPPPIPAIDSPLSA